VAFRASRDERASVDVEKPSFRFRRGGLHPLGGDTPRVDSVEADRGIGGCSEALVEDAPHGGKPLFPWQGIQCGGHRLDLCGDVGVLSARLLARNDG
jgi:hypothetical protein